MKIKLVKTGETVDAAESYGIHLIEQGQGVLVKDEEKKPEPKAKKQAEKPAGE